MSYKTKIIQEYKEKLNLYREFSFVVRNILEQFLNNQGLRFQLISNRAKGLEKLSEKIDRKQSEGKKYKKLNDIEDLAGIRIVFYLESDKGKFLQRFLQCFDHSVVSTEVKYDPKGYRGEHIIFKLNPARIRLPEYEKYRGLKCEIQVTSIFYHAWSEVEHDIIYKPQGDAELLKTLGLDDLEKTFEKLMVEHIQAATTQLDYINKKYEEIRRAGEILSGDFVNDVINSKTNDEIYGKLEVIEKFYYKKPDETLAIIEAVFKQKPLKPAIIHRFKDGILYGKKHKDIILKSIDLLSSIRYYKPDEILDLLSTFSLSDNKDIRNKSLEVVKKFSQYDYNVLTKSMIGYGAQRKVLDFVLNWTQEEQLKNFDFVETVLKELLNLSVEGSEWTKEDTLTMHFGAVSPTDFLKKIRREAIDLTFKLYRAAKDTKLKLRLVNIFNEAIRMPSNVSYGDDVVQMISGDLKYITEIYRKIVFGEKGEKMTDLLGIVAAIEERLYWINKSEKKQIEESEKLRKDILQNELYKLFRLLVGDPITYREEEGWDTAEKIRSEEINRLIGSIEKEQLEEWFNKLNKIARQYTIVDEWKFNAFKGFLRKLSEEKPQIADELLKKAFEHNSPLKYFTGDFLDGFRIGAHFEIWDKYFNEIINAEDILLVTALVSSLNFPQDANLKKFIREKDIDFLENIARRRVQFSFLKKADDRVLEYALFNTLIRNFKRSLNRIEPLIVEEIKRYPEYLNIFFIELSIATRRGWIDIKELLPETIEFLKEKMVELSDIDWRFQEFLQTIGECYGLKAVLDVFMNRIEKDVRRKEKTSRDLDERYETIPYHLNPNLVKFMVEHPDYEKIINKWVAKMTTDWSIYNWHVSHFLQSLEKGFGKVLTSLIQKGGDENLMKVARAMHSINSVDFDICIEIIRRTDNEDIIRLVGGNMYSTGVVSGEYGIAEAYEKKAEKLKKYLVDENERVRIFAKDMINSFLESAKRERQQADEEKQLRKIEFEG